MRRSRTASDDDRTRQNGSTGQSAAELQDSDGEEGGPHFVLNNDDTSDDRRELRKKYRDLINSVQREYQTGQTGRECTGGCCSDDVTRSTLGQ